MSYVGEFIDDISNLPCCTSNIKDKYSFLEIYEDEDEVNLFMKTRKDLIFLL